MRPQTCESIEPMLVDYADDVLEPPAKQHVAEHVEHCPACAETLDALQRSLELAQVVWEGNLSSGRQTAWAKAHPTKLWHYVAMAAVVVLGIGLALHWHRRPEPQPPEPELTITQIEQQIFNEGNAAKVLAAGELLAKKPESADLAQRPYRYVIENYPETNAAAIARTRIQ